MPYEMKEIVKQYIVLCEGFDTFRFVIEYLNSDALSYDKRFKEDIQVLDFGGINNLSRYIKNMKNMEGYDNINRILILRDAELSVNTAICSIQKALKENSLPVPTKCNQWFGMDKNTLKTAFSLMPSCSSNPIEGALEDLCWSILKDNNASVLQSDVRSFVTEVKNKYGCIKSHEHKSLLHTYFSVNDKYVSLKVGEAAKAGAFDWSNEKLLPLKELIMEGLNSDY